MAEGVILGLGGVGVSRQVGEEGTGGAIVGERHLLRLHEQHLHNRQAALRDEQWRYAASATPSVPIAFYRYSRLRVNVPVL